MASVTLPLYSSPLSSPVDEEKRIVIMDGGLGTTLEQTFGLDISNTPLWSAKAAIEYPEVIVDAHLAFLRAGARIILTSTYQCSLSTFEKAGYSAVDARRIMSKCVQLAAEARSRFCEERKSPDPSNDLERVKIALSLGPFGAGLTPAQEFDGYYPPPFGPRAYTPGGENRNAFPKDDEGRRQEEEATEALARFHFERLCVFSDNEAAWDALDFIAFETVPLVREIRAIRMAMAALEQRHVKGKPWWISLVFPGGKFPEALGEGDSGKVPVRVVVAAALEGPRLTAPALLPSPSALGINCTETEMIPGILVDMEDAVQEFLEQNHPWLVIYPNGGDIYDPVSQTWIVKDQGDVWAEKLAEIVAKIQAGPERGLWAGVVAGGCCRTGPDDIGLLSTQVLRRQ
ncbi:Homocysteine S-methyltransferase [Mycena maculata]|uniref:Homocysteine S-methyltransferase n=1 Tax=Mycena maculata TaxID=230809 RepID=A0AAD7P003_9AGAR|nr:Homocysteine S-methyltransferase [Mycena maculata]